MTNRNQSKFALTFAAVALASVVLATTSANAQLITGVTIEDFHRNSALRLIVSLLRLLMEAV